MFHPAPWPCHRVPRVSAPVPAVCSDPQDEELSQKILRSLFGDPAETFEDRGDVLRLNGFLREAVYFYGQALERLADTPAPGSAERAGAPGHNARTGGAGSSGSEGSSHGAGSSARSLAQRRERLGRKLTECREATFRRLLEEAESLDARGRKREALAQLTDAELFAQSTEEVDIARARRHRLETRLSIRSAGRPGVSPPPGHNAGGGTGRPGPGGASADGASAPGASPSGPPSPWSGLDFADAPEVRVARLQAEVQAHPESALAHEALGEAYRTVGRLEDARAAYEAAYQRNPERLRLVIEAARLMRSGPAADGGVASADEAPPSPGTAMPSLQKAIQRLEQACRRHRPTPASLPLHCERLLWLAEAGRVEEALAGFGDLLSVTGLDRGHLHFNRAGVQEQAGLLEGAHVDLQAAVQAAPDNAIYRERLADLCVRMRAHLPEALTGLEEALDLDAHDFARTDSGSLTGANPPERGGFAASRSSAFSADRARLLFKSARILYLLERDDEARARVADGLVICRDPRVEEALLELRRSLGA